MSKEVPQHEHSPPPLPITLTNTPMKDPYLVLDDEDTELSAGRATDES